MDIVCVCARVCVCPLFKLAYKMTVKHFLCQRCCYHSFFYPSPLFPSPLLTLHAPISTGHMLSPEARPFARLECVSVTVRVREKTTQRGGERVARDERQRGNFDCCSNPDDFLLFEWFYFLPRIFSYLLIAGEKCVIHPVYFSLLMSLRNFAQWDDLICNLVANVCRNN